MNRYEKSSLVYKNMTITNMSRKIDINTPCHELQHCRLMRITCESDGAVPSWTRAVNEENL